MSWASQWGERGDKFLVNIPATTLRISHILLKVFINKKFFGARITRKTVSSGIHRSWPRLQEEDTDSTVMIGVRDHIVHTEWQWPYIPPWLKNQPSLVREGGVRPPPFTISTITNKVVVYAPAERAYPYSTPIWTRCSRVNCIPIGLVWLLLNTHYPYLTC